MSTSAGAWSGITSGLAAMAAKTPRASAALRSPRASACTSAAATPAAANSSGTARAAACNARRIRQHGATAHAQARRNDGRYKLPLGRALGWLDSAKCRTRRGRWNEDLPVSAPALT